MQMERKLVQTEAVAQRGSVKKVLLKISQNSQKNVCARVFSFKKKTFFREHLRWLLLCGISLSVDKEKISA